ncbi:MAG: hypothetical protein ACREFM_20715, partial [Hypericibacter sp.]
MLIEPGGSLEGGLLGLALAPVIGDLLHGEAELLDGLRHLVVGLDLRGLADIEALFVLIDGKAGQG